MQKYITYFHHGAKVWVREDLKGAHHTECLCYECKRFHYRQPNNCQIAQAVHRTNQRYHLVTPVYECPKFEEKAR